MAGGGAVVAVIAARARRIQNIIDAFRVADATAPARARPLDDVGVERGAEFDTLVADGVLVAGKDSGTWYLNEAAYVERRDSRSVLPRLALIAAVVAIAMMIAFLISRSKFRG